MNVYKYDEITKEYIGVEIAHLDPLETQVQGKEVFLLPANATFTEPLITKDGYTQVYKDNVWEYVEDNRGKKYWLANDEYGTPARVMKELGVLPKDVIFEAPQKTIEKLKTEKLQEVDQWTASKITGGFISDGVRYDSDMETQTTMQGIALNVNTERFTTDYPNGIPVRGYDEGATEKTIHYLTAEEVLMFCADLSEHIGRCKLDGWTMQQAVLEATTKEELDSIILD